MHIAGVAPTYARNLVNAHLPVPYTAACPTCGADAAWTDTFSPNRLGGFSPTPHIDCPKCGPCPCGDHEKVTGVPA